MQFQMNYKFAFFFFLTFLLFSCKNENENRQVENAKDAQKKELIFSNINKGWVFYGTPINATSEASMATWTEWRLFLAELAQKPKKSIGAFQQKAKALSKKVEALNSTIPAKFDQPQIKSRIATLISKVRLLDLYIHLDKIPDQKIIGLVGEINLELVSLQRQMEKITEKSKIPLEEGESDLMKMLDTARAIPNVKPDLNEPRIE